MLEGISMNTPLITMDTVEAEKKLKLYRNKLAKDAGKQLAVSVRKQYESLRAAYYALSKGQAIVDLTHVFDICPLDPKAYPRLAICTAEAKGVEFSWSGPQRMHFTPFSDRKNYRWNTRVEVHLSHARRPEGWSSYGYARVPMIPAHIRPEKGKESDWHILWEVEEWKNTRREITPDRDPYLLRHLGGSLYAVLAEWDLSELEQAVMRDSLR
jgi:hypothetical protein